MKKFYHLLATGLFLAQISASAQTALNIQPSTTFNVYGGTQLYVDGLLFTPSADFTFNAPNSLARNTTITNTTTGKYIKRVYKWSSTLPAFSGNVTVNYLDAELNGLTESGLALDVYNGSSWKSYITGVLRDGTNNMVQTTISNVTLQELTLASQVTPLPLTWGPVKAYRKGRLAYVEWITSNESELSHYEVQKSINGVDWKQAGAPVPAANELHHQYVQPDPEVTSAKTFYRIQQVGVDNERGWSPVVAVEAIENGFTALVFPNPASSRVVVRSESGINIQMISAYTSDGKLLLNKRINAAEYKLDLTSWLPGTYLLQVTGTDGRISHHTIVKK